jgi:hypothetical protein
MALQSDYPVHFYIDYPYSLNRLTTFFRIILAIPFIIVAWALVAGSGGFVIPATALMILFRKKYPEWWFNWNRELLAFSSRLNAYVLLLRDEYPSTDDEQAIHLEMPYPDAELDLSRWLPLVKWILAIPHIIIVSLLGIIVLFVTIIAWFVILITGKYPGGLYSFVEGTMRWSIRVTAYAFLMVTDRYPPFSFNP